MTQGERVSSQNTYLDAMEGFTGNQVSPLLSSNLLSFSLLC